MRLGVSFEPAIPVGLEFRSALDALPESAERLVGYVKGGLERPSVELLRELDFVGAERLAMRLRIVMPIRAAVADMATNTNQRRPARLGASVFDCACECGEVVGVLHRLSMPSVGFEPFSYVFGENDLGVAVDRELIVAVWIDYVAEAPV